MLKPHTILRVSDFIFINDFFFWRGNTYLSKWFDSTKRKVTTEELFFKVVGDSSMPRMRFHAWSPWKPPKRNSSPLKNGGWKTALLSYWEGSFSGATWNFGRVLSTCFSTIISMVQSSEQQKYKCVVSKSGWVVPDFLSKHNSLICEISVVSNHWFVYKCKMGLDSLTLFAALQPNDPSLSNTRWILRFTCHGNLTRHPKPKVFNR